MNESKRKRLVEVEVELPAYMMATKAFHQLGEISSKEPDICHVNKKVGGHYIGSWVFGFGFFNVKFPVETTRELTSEEVAKYNKGRVQLADHTPYKLNIPLPKE